MSETSNPASKPPDQKVVRYALRLYEKGYSVAELARILDVSEEALWEAFDEVTR